MSAIIRRIIVSAERSFHEGGPRLGKPVKRGWAAAIVENPFANKYVEDLVPFMDSLEPMAFDMTVELLEALKLRPGDIESYGKGAIVGINGEMEHAAMWHAPGGAGLRRGVGGGNAGVPGSMKFGAPGTTIDLSLGNMDASNVRSHYDTISVNLGDAPKPNEIAYIVALSDSGRPHARLGTLVTAEAARHQTGRP
jgi:hypothetical protein